MSLKVVEGQLEHLQLYASFSTSSRSLSSELFREYVANLSKSQTFAPDVIPAHVDVKPLIEAGTGKLVTEIG